MDDDQNQTIKRILPFGSCPNEHPRGSNSKHPLLRIKSINQNKETEMSLVRTALQVFPRNKDKLLAKQARLNSLQEHYQSCDRAGIPVHLASGLQDKVLLAYCAASHAVSAVMFLTFIKWMDEGSHRY
eukprot:TRINITY_DN1420_c1_g1_i2.p1 TRINITY_DN1420_c1_g1~~TRINITY_DN1420_c1_g1_i2.p1  ORF type:complete len:128 (-),score=24.42 TRINITY_DN1420_c1_g1_i2:738-1121(-)